MKLALSLLLSLFATGSAFQVERLMEPTQTVVHDADERLLRHTNEAEIYTNTDRLLWTSPDTSSLRHSETLESMQANDRTWRYPSKNVVQTPGGQNQPFTLEDRKWGFPDSSKIRRSGGQAPTLGPEDRIWRMPHPGLLLQE